VWACEEEYYLKSSTRRTKFFCDSEFKNWVRNTKKNISIHIAASMRSQANQGGNTLAETETANVTDYTTLTS